MRFFLVLPSCVFFLCSLIFAQRSTDDDYVTIAILAKDKEHTLPLYLSCIEQQTWPAEKKIGRAHV